MSISSGSAAFKLSYQISPIILTGGIAASMPGGALPIMNITNAPDFVGGLLGSGADLDLDDFFANYQPLPGSTLIDQKIGMYPFANQSVAANAVIREPLTISMLMICPVNAANGYQSKLSAITALQTTLQQHNLSGGTYTIVTPSFVYANCVFVTMVDASHSESKQVQTAYRLDFIQPLVTLQQAQAAQNSMMSQISAGVPSSGALNGLSPTIGSPASTAAPSVVTSSPTVAGLGINSGVGVNGALANPVGSGASFGLSGPATSGGIAVGA
jgi:hypothetical protein